MPFEENFVYNLNYLVERMDSISSLGMLRARRSIEMYKTDLVSHCMKFNADGIERIICTGMTLDTIHFIIRIDLMRHWQTEMIIKDKSQVLIRKLADGPPLIAELQNRYEREDTSIEQEYMLIKLLLEFNSYYIENGRIFPAYVEVINRDSCIQQVM
ncbi:MAG: hypothetical protein ACOX8Q_02160 [Christensenellales bacterium]